MKSKKWWWLLAAVVLVVAMVFFFSRNDVTNYAEKYEGTDLSTDVTGVGRENTYANYLLEHGEEPKAQTDLEINLGEMKSSQDAEMKAEYEGRKQVLYTGEDSMVEWEVNVPKSGLYQIKFDYFPVESRGVDIERCLYINGEVPFVGADALTFSRLWTDGGEVRKDNQGNEIRPSQVEAPAWTSAYCRDDMGYHIDPYMFYLEEGINTIGVEAVNEPMAISAITLCAVAQSPSYEEYETEVGKDDGNTPAFKQVIQGEDSVLRSSPSLYATYDRSSSNTEPYNPSKITLNMTGGDSWRVAGQWIEWEFEVPDDGYYEIAIKARQNAKRGSVSNRAVYIDGEIPFEEVSSVGFSYDTDWISYPLESEDGEAYEFYLEKGTHTLRLEVTMGDLGEILTTMEDSVYRLNEMYRKILVLTGTSPDKYRDYKIDTVYPEVIEAMDLESKRLYKIIDDVVAYTGQKADQVATVQTIAKQLEKFVKRPDKIPQMLSNFKDNISSMGTTILTMSEAPLDIDYITITAGGEKPDKVHETFLAGLAHEFRSFYASFVEDYNSLGDVYEEGEAIEVWILSGRDQSTILKSMIDDTFTPESGIKVNVKLVEAATVLNAVIAGNGPDLVISAAQGEPVNYALRNAAEDLTQFDGWEELFSEYYESAYEPYKYEGGIYGLPETQNYSVMFYREDILEELGVEVPQTWDDLINILPTIQQNNMSVAIPSANASIANLSGLYAMLYQNGGAIYNEDGTETVLDDEAGTTAVEMYTRFFTHYKLPSTYDFVNRFRSGEMPIGIQDYSTYNTLVVFAPEIRGLWNFTLIPGTEQEDGTINRASASSGVCSMMLKNDDEDIKQKAWQFLKWWGSSDVQVRFGRELESVMGSSARYATANTVAFNQLAWSREQIEVLEEQWKWVVGIPEVAGGYYTSRHVTNAMRKIINNNTDPRETMLDYAITINEEIEKKRIEFGLDEK